MSNNTILLIPKICSCCIPDNNNIALATPGQPGEGQYHRQDVGYGAGRRAQE